MMAAGKIKQETILGDLLPVNVAQQNILVSSIVDVIDEILPQGLLIAREGKQFNPLQHVERLIQKQPSVIVCAASNPCYNEIRQKQLAKAGIALIAVEDLQAASIAILQRFYQRALQAVSLVAVTGTDGKSSVAMLYAMMDADKTAVIGTLGYGRFDQLIATGMTTPGMVALYRIIDQLYQQGFEQIVMEVSSHAIDQQRIAGLQFAVSIITNLGRDHLDYHPSVEHYQQSKLGFIQGEQSKKRVINADDKFIEQQTRKLDNSVFYGMNHLAAQGISAVDYLAEGIRLSFSQQGFDALTLNLYGKFNLYNLLAVIAAKQQMGASWQQIYQGLRNIHAVAGRMEKLQDKQGRHVFIDFAHTPNGLDNALQAIRQHFTSRIHLVFGCGGDRDSGKRPLMGQIAEKHADEIILTDDNPRTEDPEQISSQVLAGMTKPQRVMVIHDRYQAIRQGLQHCQPGEVLLIAGKGHEREQIGAQGKQPFHDATVVRQLQEAGL